MDKGQNNRKGQTMNNLEKSIIEELPQIPYVIDQVSDAISWAKEKLDEGDFNHMLRVAYDVTLYVKSISEPTFFKTHLVVASILSNIPEVLSKERIKKFETTSNAVENTLRHLIVTPEKVTKNGCFKAILLNLVPLQAINEEIFTVALVGIKHDLLAITEGMNTSEAKAPITSQDYISVLGYALVMANLRMANLKLQNKTYEIYNDISIILNELNY